MALSAREQLRKQFETANDVQNPSAAVAIASTFGLSNACASNANQEDSDIDVRLFGIVQSCTEVRESSSPCPPSSGGRGRGSAAASEVVTVMSADWRRTASEQAQAQKQFAKEQLVLPSSACTVAVPSPDQTQPAQELQPHTTSRSPADGNFDEISVQYTSRSQGGTVRETQTGATPASTAGAGVAPAVPHGARACQLQESEGLESALYGTDASDCGNASDVYTIKDTHRGSSEAKKLLESAVDAGDLDVLGLETFPSTQLQGVCDTSSFQATQLEPAQPSCRTCPTQITGQEVCALEADVITPAHSTDTQPADASLNLNSIAVLTHTAAEDGVQAETSPSVHDEAASVDPKLQAENPAPDRANPCQQRALRQEPGAGNLPAVAGFVPPPAFDELGNSAYLLPQPRIAVIQPDSVILGVAAQMSVEKEAVPVSEASTSPTLQQLPERSPSSHPGDDSAVKHALTTHGHLAHGIAEHAHLPGNPIYSCPLPEADADSRKAGLKYLPDAGTTKCKQFKTSPAANPTQATVCDSSDVELETPKVGDDCLHLKDLIVAMEDERVCRSTSCGTVPETYTGDGTMKAPLSQQTVRHPCKRERRGTNSHLDSIVLQPRNSDRSHITVTPHASPAPSITRRAAGSASRGSAQLAAIKKLTQHRQSDTPSDSTAAGKPGDRGNNAQRQSAAHPRPAPAGHAMPTPGVECRTDRVARKRKAQQQQSARISQVASATPVPAQPPARPASVHRTPPANAPHLGAPVSPHVSPLLQLDARLSESQVQFTPKKRRRTAVSVAVTPQRQTPSPIPATAAQLARTPTRADLTHCTLQPTCVAKQSATCRSMRQGAQKHSHHSTPTKSAQRSPANVVREVHNRGRGRASGAAKPMSNAPCHAGASLSQTGTRDALSRSPGKDTKKMTSGLTDEDERAARTQRTSANNANMHQRAHHDCPEAATSTAVVVMTESQLSLQVRPPMCCSCCEEWQEDVLWCHACQAGVLQNWIDDRPVACPSHRGMKAPEPPRFSEKPARLAAQSFSPTFPLSPVDLPEVRVVYQESEEHEIRQIRSSNKVIRVLDSQTAELFERQPDGVAPSKSRRQMIAHGTGNRNYLCKGRSDWVGRAPHITPHTAAVQVPVTSTAIACLPVPAAPPTMPTSIPCVFVSSQQGAKSCERHGKEPMQQVSLRTCPQQTTPKRKSAVTHPGRAQGAPHTPCTGGARPGSRRHMPAPQLSTSTEAPNLNSVGAEAAHNNRPGRKSAPAGGEWQRRRTRAGNYSFGNFADDIARKPQRAARMPSPAHLGQLSPDGVRRSARIAAHNIAPAADGDTAFGAIGALSQARSLSAAADSQQLPQSMMPVARVRASSQGKGGAYHSEKAHCHAPATALTPPQCPPVPKGHHTPTSGDPGQKRVCTTSRATSYDENQRDQGNGTPNKCCERDKAASPLKPIKKRGAMEERVLQASAGRLSFPATVLPQAPDQDRPDRMTGLTPSASHRTLHTAVLGGTKQASQFVDANDLSWGQKGECSSAWKQTYCEFVSRKWGSVRIGDVVCAEGAHAGPLFIQVERLWFNQCTKEDCMAGTRLYPVSDTPFAVFVPGGVDKHRVLALGDDSWTVPLSCFVRPLRVVYMGSGSKCISEADATETLCIDPDCFLCHFRLESSGGLFPL